VLVSMLLRLAKAVHRGQRANAVNRAVESSRLRRPVSNSTLGDMIQPDVDPSTYGHSQLKTGHPVRSAIHKQLNGRLVLRWVTTWESLLLYVLHLPL
jgi:hypothetical protein